MNIVCIAEGWLNNMKISNNFMDDDNYMGHRNKHGPLTTSLCMPDTDTIMEMVRRKIK